MVSSRTWVAHAAAPVDVVSAVVERLQRSERAAGRDIPGVVGEALAGVEQLDEMHGVEAEQAAALREVGAQGVRRAVADGTGRPRRLVDVLVVEDALHPPRGLAQLPPEIF
jgi:hypothetical protein